MLELAYDVSPQCRGCAGVYISHLERTCLKILLQLTETFTYIYCAQKVRDIGAQKNLEIKLLICRVNILSFHRAMCKPVFLHNFRAENWVT